MSIKENLKHIINELQGKAELVAVSKTKTPKTIMEAYDAGQKVFGENKVQELIDKKDELPEDIQWHMIGHLQRNKVKYIAPFITLIHSVDSLKLLKAIEKEGEKNERIIECLLQMHVAKEETKFGMDEEELKQLLSSTEYLELKHVKIRGLMGMATFTGNMEIVRDEFRYLKKLFDQTYNSFFNGNPDFSILSMGMSHDYKIAIEEGSTMVRIGSSIFGERIYT
ncbi:MAG: YggS family pyridoxal phosphate-dependent enzyme [Bacteroidales bacterium]